MSATVRCDGRLERPRSSSLRLPDIGEDTFIRCTSCDFAANVEAVHHPGSRRRDRPRRPSAAAVVHDTPEARPPSRLSSTIVNGDSKRCVIPDRDWTAADTLEEPRRQPQASRRHRRTPWRVGIPGRSRRRHEAPRSGQVAPAEAEPFSRGGLREAPVASTKGYIGPGVARGSDNASGIRYLLDPRIVDPARPWITGRRFIGQPARPATSPPVATSPPTERYRGGRESSMATPARRAAPTSRSLAASRSHTSSSSVRKYAEALDLSVQRRGRPARHPHHGRATASASPAALRRSPRPPATTAGSAGRARSHRPTCTS